MSLSQNIDFLSLCECSIAVLLDIFAMVIFDLEPPGPYHSSVLTSEDATSNESTAAVETEEMASKEIHFKQIPLFELKNQRIKVTIRVDSRERCELIITDLLTTFSKIHWCFSIDHASFLNFKDSLITARNDYLSKSAPCERDSFSDIKIAKKTFSAEKGGSLIMISEPRGKERFESDNTKIAVPNIKSFVPELPNTENFVTEFLESVQDDPIQNLIETYIIQDS